MNYILLRPLPTLKANSIVDETNPMIKLLLETKDEKEISYWLKPEPTEEDLLTEQLEFEQRELEFAFGEKVRLEEELNNINMTITSVEKNVQSLEIEKGKLHQQIKNGEVDVKK
jgi:hypothetical protein